MTNTISYERYQRQMILKDFGEGGQYKLLQAKVLVIGAGGLGCPSLLYLAAAGIGTIGIMDDDLVSLSNLHRQILFSVNDIGLLKVERAKEELLKLNSEININAIPERLTTKNALSILDEYQIIIDGTDNFASRYMINDACVLLKKPLVYGAISQYEGQVAVFNYKKNENDEAVNYRDLFPVPPTKDEVLNCAEAGVLGVLAGIIGTMQANETIKLITGIGKPLINQLLTYNALNNQLFEISLSPCKDASGGVPPNKKAFEQTDYDWLCNAGKEKFELDGDEFEKLIARGDVDVIDVRELNEMPDFNGFGSHRIPLKLLQENLSLMQSGNIITICQSGKRSSVAAKQLAAIFGTSKKIYSLRGGISQWNRQHENEL